MPIIAQCKFCNQKVRAPDQAAGVSICCPKCRNYFTIAPTEAVPNTAAANTSGGWTPAASEPASLFPVEEMLPLNGALDYVPPPPRPRLHEDADADSSAASEQGGWRRHIHPGGVVALWLVALALVAASFPGWRWLVVLLCANGFLTALGAFLVTFLSHRPRPIVPAVGGVLALALLGTVLIFPGWLNERWAMDFPVPEPDLNLQELVSSDNTVKIRDLTADDWVNADKQALRQGDLLIRVDKVVVGKVEGLEQPCLQITLVIANVGMRLRTYHGQGIGDQVPLLRDQQGRKFQSWHLGDGEVAEKAGQLPTVSVLSDQEVQDVLLFNLPDPDAGDLRLELPAAAWERKGTCRFLIPQTLLMNKDEDK